MRRLLALLLLMPMAPLIAQTYGPTNFTQLSVSGLTTLSGGLNLAARTGAIQIGTPGTNNAVVFNVPADSTNGCFGIYASSDSVNYGICSSLPGPAGWAALGGFYHGLGISGTTKGAGFPIFGVLIPGQYANGLQATAFSVDDFDKVETYNNVLDDGAGDMDILGSIKIGTNNYASGFPYLSGSAAPPTSSCTLGSLDLNSSGTPYALYQCLSSNWQGVPVQSQVTNAVAITGGSIDGAPIGATTPSTGAFTTMAASSYKGTLLPGAGSGTAYWVKVGTWTVGNLADTLGMQVYSGAGYNANQQQQAMANIVIRGANSNGAPNLSGASAYTFGSQFLLGLKVAATGGSTSGANTSWDVYLDMQAYTAGAVFVQMLPGDTWTYSGTVASDPGAASTSVVVGSVLPSVGTQIATAAGCSFTASAIGAGCFTTVTIPIAEPDANYTPTCSIIGPLYPTVLGGIGALSTSSFQIGSYAMSSSSTGGGTVKCIIAHS